MTMNPNDWIDLIISKADALRAAGVESIEADGRKATLRPPDPPEPPDPDDDEDDEPQIRRRPYDGGLS